MSATVSAPRVTRDDPSARAAQPISYADRWPPRAHRRPQLAPRRSLVDGIPATARLHVVTGKGGTGKTTVAAALALALADSGRKVLLVEVEGRQAIAQLFDMPPLPYSEERLTGAGQRRRAVRAGHRPRAGDARVPRDVLRPQAAGKRPEEDGRGRLRDHARARACATSCSPARSRRRSSASTADGSPVYDAVVLDAPPTGRIGRFLDATQEVAKLTKFGPINNQSEGVIELLHGPKTARAPRDPARGDAGAGDDRRRGRAAPARLPARRGRSSTAPGPTLITDGPGRRRRRGRPAAARRPGCDRPGVPAAHAAALAARDGRVRRSASTSRRRTPRAWTPSTCRASSCPT